MKKGIENRVIALDALTPHQRNYNRHSAAQIADLRESLKQFGQVRSIVVQADKAGKRYTAVAGHGIAEAARAEGYTELRADVIPHSWSETRVLAYLAADNELARHGDPDTEQLAAIVRDVMEAEGEALARLAAGEQAALDAILNAGDNKDEPEGRADELLDASAELNKKWQVQPNDIWQIGRHRLLCGDSTDETNLILLTDAKKCDVVLTDPPYNYDFDYKGHDDDKEDEEYDAFLRKWYPLAQKFSPRVVTTPGLKNLLYYYRITEITWVCAWVKENAMTASKIGNLSVWEPIIFDATDFDWEPIIVDGKPKKKVKRDVYKFPTRVQSDTANHPCPKRLEFWEALLKDFSQPNDRVLDFFCGSGTTLVSCERQNRVGFGIEQSPEYCAVILERMSALGLTPTRVTESGTNGKQKRGR